jgi:hypothetical protein
VLIASARSPGFRVWRLRPSKKTKESLFIQPTFTLINIQTIGEN